MEQTICKRYSVVQSNVLECVILGESREVLREI